MTNQNLRQHIEQLFGLPAMKMPWTLYLAQLNEAGKLTARSTMDILTVVLTSMEEMEEKVKEMNSLMQSKYVWSNETELPPQPATTIIAKPIVIAAKPQELPQELKA
jgi:hypothetical protein